MKLLYRALNAIVGVLGGLLAAKLFGLLWRLLPGTDESAPAPTDRDHGWREILVAAVLQGAVYGGVKALVGRAGARGFEHATGTWPG